jgi:hypothetical protein
MMARSTGRTCAIVTGCAFIVDSSQGSLGLEPKIKVAFASFAGFAATADFSRTSPVAAQRFAIDPFASRGSSRPRHQ